MAISTSSHVGSRAEGDTGIDCHPCGNPYINVGHIHKYPDLKVPIVCAKETAATDKNSASGSPDVMTCSVVYRYRFHYRIKTEDQKAQISRAEAFIIVCVGAQGFRNKGGTLGTPRHKHKNEDDILWKEFNSARQEFYKRRSKYYSELDEQHANNKQKKQTLISEARSIAQFSTEWKSSGERLNELMDKWKTVGSAGKDNDDSLWKEFNSARQTFYDRRRIYYAEQDRQFQNNADRKSRIVQEASAISSCCDYSSQSTE